MILELLVGLRKHCIFDEFSIGKKSTENPTFAVCGSAKGESGATFEKVSGRGGGDPPFGSLFCEVLCIICLINVWMHFGRMLVHFGNRFFMMFYFVCIICSSIKFAIIVIVLRMEFGITFARHTPYGSYSCLSVRLRFAHTSKSSGISAKMLVSPSGRNGSKAHLRL